MIALVAGSAAQAGAWDEFEQRCLLAYENGFPALTDGLTEAPLPGLAENEVAFSGLEGGALLILEKQPSDGFSACRVFFSQAEEIDGFKSWADQQLADDRYETETEMGGDADVALLSHLWIEPALGVQLRQTRGGHELRIVETEEEA